MNNYSMPSYFQNMPVIGKALLNVNEENVAELKAREAEMAEKVEAVLEAGQQTTESLNAKGQMTAMLYDGVKKCLETLKAQGFHIVLASSKPENYCRIILEYLGVSDFFDDIVGATIDGKIHSKEQVLEEVFRRCDFVDKSECCLVGDTIFDVNGANYIGIPCVGVSYGFGKSDEMKACGAKVIIDNICELFCVIK